MSVARVGMESGSQDGADSPSGHVAAQRGLLAVMWLWIQDRLLVRIPGGATINFYVQNAPYGNWICAPYSAIHHGPSQVASSPSPLHSGGGLPTQPCLVTGGTIMADPKTPVKHTDAPNDDATTHDHDEMKDFKIYGNAKKFHLGRIFQLWNPADNEIHKCTFIVIIDKHGSAQCLKVYNSENLAPEKKTYAVPLRIWASAPPPVSETNYHTLEVHPEVKDPGLGEAYVNVQDSYHVESITSKRVRNIGYVKAEWRSTLTEYHNSSYSNG
ncbi:uncharacterized protein HMPREF1541_05366 [Cyphellophora europaea CBS 101466]|uniref:Uncharacterized protein n=1 Tax=Cyphellophora europaea (strain CBS 101466) TaxID=1220924 RepID=W2RTR1_CYPE1|nr:uncharacterized protein HMPREF1541_05366 [Cyphellophora europaea CBS 101466]ETN39143.1 hypothetical protein HMPREF1541_05366 [Cyphellophora europaea CBS 101466]